MFYEEKIKVKKQKLPEKECPECKGEINWKISHESLGSPKANGLCKKCNIIFWNREPPEITEGKKLERKGKIKGTLIKNIPALDDRITSLPSNVQLGILRERQKEM